MGIDEENLIHGRILSNYLAAKKRLVALEAKANAYADLFDRLKNSFSRGVVSSEVLEKDLASLPTATDLRNLLAEIEEAKEQKKNGEDSLRQMGVEIK